ncbi:MAG TPA: hypothetical protein VHW60_01655 [Caulobacteraceae bacterium]|jgi:hypothetical protein|nr:hypothetical protein [Caulobacteraceae bacterium]
MRHPQDLYGDPDLKLEGLSIWALGRQFPNSEDYWDGNWMTVHAHVEAPGARIDAQRSWLRADEIEGFLEQLEALNRDLKGTAELACMEPTLNVKVTCGSLGHIQVVVEITPDHMTQSHRIDFASDQTYLASAMKGCRAILAKYPVKKPIES